MLKNDDKSTINLILKKHKYFTDHIENKKKYSAELYQNTRKDLLTISALKGHLDMTKYLLEQGSLFIETTESETITLDRVEKLITGDKLDEITEIKVSFIQEIFKSNYNQDIKLDFTQMILGFISSIKLKHDHKETIINNVAHDAQAYLAYKSFDALLTYLKKNNMHVEYSNKGPFSRSSYGDFNNS